MKKSKSIKIQLSERVATRMKQKVNAVYYLPTKCDGYCKYNLSFGCECEPDSVLGINSIIDFLDKERKKKNKNIPQEYYEFVTNLYDIYYEVYNTDRIEFKYIVYEAMRECNTFISKHDNQLIIGFNNRHQHYLKTIWLYNIFKKIGYMGTIKEEITNERYR